MNSILLVVVSIIVLTFISALTILFFIQNKKKRIYKQMLDSLEIEKNIIDSSQVAPELGKIYELKKNEKLDILYNDWSERFDKIKNISVPKITDMILEAEHSLSKSEYKDTLYRIAKLEIEIYKTKTSNDILLGEIKEITNSEQKNRTLMIGLKSRYRGLYSKFTETKEEYMDAKEALTLQFENINRRFEDFENIMENHEYTEVKPLVKAIEEMLKHMSVIIEEMPSIMLIIKKLIPNKIKEIKEIYDYMINNGYPLDYLNVEYNIEESNKKIEDILDRASILNIEDSLLELKVLTNYFDSIYTDFEKEKNAKKEFSDGNKIFSIKIKKITKLITDIFNQIDEIRKTYDLSEDDVKMLFKIKDEINKLNNDYKVLIDHTGNKTFPFTKLVKEIELFNTRLTLIEENLDNYLDAVGSMKDDEARARQQLDEVKTILKEAKYKLRDYHIPVIPRTYYVELNEANAALKEIALELSKKPITINTLNTRVDTARDLSLKLFNKTENMLKMAKFAEGAIVYGNRYRTIENVDKHLNVAESLFYEGEYKKSLEITINALNKIEPGIYQKLITLYGSNK